MKYEKKENLNKFTKNQMKTVLNNENDNTIEVKIFNKINFPV